MHASGSTIVTIGGTGAGSRVMSMAIAQLCSVPHALVSGHADDGARLIPRVDDEAVC